MSASRRSFLAGMVAVGAALPAAAAEGEAAASPSRLVLLGTGGGPVLGGQRSMAASAIIAGGRTYLIDCGYGASLQIAKAGLAVSAIDGVFITHNHADHMLDYGPLLFFSWLQGRTLPIDVYGPPPLRQITRDLLAANQAPLDFYRVDMDMRGMPPVEVHELTGAGPVMQDRVARVTCCLVHHPPVRPAFAYRFDLPDRSIVFSGDTSPVESLIALAKGADILVHEAAEVDLVLAMMEQARRAPQPGVAQPRDYDAARFRDHVYRAHSSAEDAGRIAAAAGVKTLVLNHLSPASSKIAPDTMWMADAGKHFSGRIVVGKDGLWL